MLIEHYELPNIQLKSKLQWKNLVNRAIVTANRSDIIDKAKGYKKIDCNKLSTEKYGLKEYFIELNVPDAKLFFAIRSRMTRYIQTNYKGN